MIRKKWLVHILPAIALLLWALAIFGQKMEDRRLSAKEVAQLVSQRLVQQQKEFQEILLQPQKLQAWMDARQPGSDFLSNRKFYVYAYLKDSLAAWSNNSILPQLDTQWNAHLVVLSNGLYIQEGTKALQLPSDVAFRVLYPIAFRYSLSNDYFKDRFLASDRIPPDTRIIPNDTLGAAPIKDAEDRVVGYIPSQEAADVIILHYDWSNWVWALSLGFLCLWFHQMARRLAAGKKGLLGLGLLVVFIVVVRGLLYLRGVPVHLGDTDLFSPRLFATSSWLPSLGDLLVNTIAILWLGFFMIRYIGWEQLGKLQSKWIKTVIVVVGAALLAWAGIYYVSLLSSLVLNSIIPYDIQHLSSVDLSTITGLLTATLVTAAGLTQANIFRKLIFAFKGTWVWRLVSAISGMCIGWLLFRPSENAQLGFVVLVWLLFFTLGQGLLPQLKTSGIFRPKNVLWSTGHCLLLCLLLYQFVQQREKVAKRSFAEHIATRQDEVLEYSFSQIEAKLAHDTGIISFLKQPTNLAKAQTEERLASTFFNRDFSGYAIKLSFFDSLGHALLNPDTTSFPTRKLAIEVGVPSSQSTALYFFESASDDNIYKGNVSVRDKEGRQLGSIIMDFEQKKIVSETVLPELFQPRFINRQVKNADYSYAYYVNNRLVAQSNNFPFPFQIPNDTSDREFSTRETKRASTLVYRPDSHRTVLVWQSKQGYAFFLTLFSYLLLIRFLLIGLLRLYYFLSQGYAWRIYHYGVQRMTLRKRVQLSVLGIVLFSFLIIGVITVLFLRNQYQNKTNDQRRTMMQAVSNSLHEYFNDESRPNEFVQLSDLDQLQRFSYYINALAAHQKVDINLYAPSGALVFSSQPTLYSQGIVVPRIAWTAYRGLQASGKWYWVQEEQIGRLKFMSCYTSIWAKGGKLAGFINVPLFNSERELEEQISSLIVSLVNIYVLIFLLSSLVVVLISRWITRAFDVIIEQFGSVSLHGNEMLDWPYDDEVGVLVREYNKMVKKVEANATLLAKSEREGAWKEMAKQVAHEIKNPLTPMSLNIQYLQNALNSGRTDTKELVLRVCDSLLEQINNLSVIASEFSQFARISTTPEKIALSEVLPKITNLYNTSANLQIQYQPDTMPRFVWADRSQLVRILTNLMQNAKQAIPEERVGLIKVTVSSDEHALRISIEDNGLGISAEAQAKLFTPYFTTKSSGTGLGLAMSQQMMEQWGGTISYTTVLGQGTCFTLEFPVCPKLSSS